MTWHLMTFEDGHIKAACGQTGSARYTNMRFRVDCARCKRTRKWKEGLVIQAEKEQTEPSFATTRDVAITAERRLTVHECIAFLREGDRNAAHYRLVRGFERQCRIAGLESAIHGEKADA